MLDSISVLFSTFRIRWNSLEGAVDYCEEKGGRTNSTVNRIIKIVMWISKFDLQFLRTFKGAQV
jgi:hypothetical protein